MSVLKGASQAIADGRVHTILLEYGDKTSPAIWDAMKRQWGAAAAASSPREMPGTSLYSMQQWGDANGFDTFLLGGNHRVPVLVPVTGRMWHDSYEVCRDKKQKYSHDGRHWRNFSAWNPTWSAVCWFDIVLIRRESRALLRMLLDEGALSRHGRFCERLRNGWFPSWIHTLPPSNLKCAHK
eukprot:3323697-Prymnesium_polylepis.2